MKVVSTDEVMRRASGRRRKGVRVFIAGVFGLSLQEEKGEGGKGGKKEVGGTNYSLTSR